MSTTDMNRGTAEPPSQTELDKAIEQLKNWSHRYPGTLNIIETVCSAARRAQEAERERVEYEIKIINISCLGTSETQFNSVGEMQIAGLYKHKKELDHQLTSANEALKLAAEALKQNHKWHQDYDEYGGYDESDLGETNMKALTALDAKLKEIGV